MDYTANQGGRVTSSREGDARPSRRNSWPFPRPDHDRQIHLIPRREDPSGHATTLRGQHEPREGRRQAISVAVPVRAEQSAWELSSSALQRRVGPAERVHPTSRCTHR